MKNVFLVLVVSCVLLCGCENKKFSELNTQNCKNIISTIDKYIDDRIDEDEAYDRISDLEIEYEELDSDEFNANLKVAMIKTELVKIDINRNNIVSNRNELAELCGLSSRK